MIDNMEHELKLRLLVREAIKLKKSLNKKDESDLRNVVRTLIDEAKEIDADGDPTKSYAMGVQKIGKSSKRWTSKLTKTRGKIIISNEHAREV